MDQRNLNEIKKRIDTFYDDRKLTLRYSREGDFDVLYDNRVAFVGTLTEDQKKPADGKAIVFYQSNLFVIVL